MKITKRCKEGLKILTGLMAMSCVGLVHAGGGQNYPNGAESFMSGAAPPPGFYFLDYGYYYQADKMKDDKGHSISAFDDVRVIANVFRFLWMSNQTLFGASYGQHLFIPVLNTDLNFNAPVGPRASKGYDDSGVPYLIYNPMILAWHLMEGSLHVVASPADIYIPTGQENGNMASVGKNIWTFEPVLALTYLNNGWEFSGKFMYDFNTTQDKYATVYGLNVDREPGQEFHFDYSVSYGVTPNLRLGLSGYYYTQITDDSYDKNAGMPAPVRDLLKADEGQHSRVFAVGPGIWYNQKNMFFELRSQFEMDARNKTEGQNVWLKFTYAF
ncbi:Phenol degradation protein meta [Gammaproteobacteria bacterium]